MCKALYPCSCCSPETRTESASGGRDGTPHTGENTQAQYRRGGKSYPPYICILILVVSTGYMYPKDANIVENGSSARGPGSGTPLAPWLKQPWTPLFVYTSFYTWPLIYFLNRDKLLRNKLVSKQNRIYCKKIDRLW